MGFKKVGVEDFKGLKQLEDKISKCRHENRKT
jgi:hypothetical protein